MEAFIDWFGGLTPMAKVIVLSMLPIFELRGSIPYGLLATPLSPLTVVGVAIVTNWLIAPLVYYLLPAVVRPLLRFGWFEKLWGRYTARVQAKIHASVERYGVWGIALFIGIPLPLTGVYSGALGAYLLGLSFPRFMLAAAAGVVMATLIVTAAVLSGSSAFQWLLNTKALH